MSDSDEDKVSVADVTVKAETGKAILCVVEEEDVWVPKSIIDDDSEVYKMGTEGVLIVPAWFAKKNGFI